MSAFINFSSSRTVVPSSLNSYDIDPVKEPMRCLDSSYTHISPKPLQKQSCATGLTHDICTTPFMTHKASLRLVCQFIPGYVRARMHHAHSYCRECVHRPKGPMKAFLLSLRTRCCQDTGW